jgi:hypothetical protein
MNKWMAGGLILQALGIGIIIGKYLLFIHPLWFFIPLYSTGWYFINRGGK